MSRYKLGALPPQRPYGLSEMATYAVGKLPAPPASVDAPTIPSWGMMANDRLGCCTISGAGHAVMTWNAAVHEKDPVPTAIGVAETYEALTGGADTGLVEADVLRTWQRSGLFGERIAAYAPVSTNDLTGFHQAIAFYGGAYLSVALPESAEAQFAAGQTWTVEPGSPIAGGHCVWACGYGPYTAQVVTWGQLVEVSYPWLAHYLTETWAIIPNEFVEAGHGPALDLASLRRDLDAL